MSLFLPRPESEVKLTLKREGGDVVLRLEVDGKSCGSTTGSPWTGEPFTMQTALESAERYMHALKSA